MQVQKTLDGYLVPSQGISSPICNLHFFLSSFLAGVAREGGQGGEQVLDVRLQQGNQEKLYILQLCNRDDFIAFL